jgi:hypothetical protein
MANPISDTTVVPISPALAGVVNEDVLCKDDTAPSVREEAPITDYHAKTNRDVENAPAVPWQSGAQPQDGQQPLRV